MTMASIGQRMMLRAIAARGGNNLAVAATTNSSSTTASAVAKASNKLRTTSNKLMMSTMSGGAMLAEMAKENPYKDVVRYEHKNRKWTLQHVDYYSDALACGFLENGLQPGDKVLSWLPSHFSESMVLQFACSKSGLILYNLDPTLVKDKSIEEAKESLAMALKLTEANVLISQEAGDDVNYIRICEKVIPEIRIFDFSTGHPFVTPRFPHLRFPIHTGYDQYDKWGMLLFKHFVVPSQNLDTYLEGFTVDGSTPLVGELVLDSNGIPTSLGKVLTNDEVQASGMWASYSNILNREYHEVEGVGVVW